MARSAAHRAERTAAALDDFLLQAKGASNHLAHAAGSGRASIIDRPAGASQLSQPVAIEAPNDPEQSAPAGSGGSRPPLCLPQTDWLFHEVVVRGAPKIVDTFQAIAAGAGIIPWRHDFDRLEEDWFHRMAAPDGRTLSIAACRTLARQLRDAAERRHGLAVAAVGRSRACPLDLHALVPVPDAVLGLGADHPAARAWLWRHWGTTQALRHVRVLSPARKRAAACSGDALLHIEFWSADWSPWQALVRIRADWPALRLDLQPHYDPP